MGRVLDDLGSTLLEVVAGHVSESRPVGGVVIYDPVDPPMLPDNAIVLGVGLHDRAEAVSVLRECGEAGAAALVVRAPDDAGNLLAAAEESGVVLFGLTRGASWAQVAALLHSLLAVGDLAETDGETLAGAAAGDLFALAGAVSALLDAPVTIEDLNSRVLAFSPDQEQADESRKQTILGRQVPDRYTRELTQRGVFRTLYGSDSPVYITGLPDVDLPRVAIRVRAGDEILGSMWAAVGEPLSAEREQAFIDSAKLVALHLLRRRAGADVERRLRTDLVATVLEGGAGAEHAAARLGVATGPSCVLAMGLATDEAEPSVEAELQRVSSAAALHMSAVHPRSATALIGGVVYGLMPLPDTSPGAEDRAAAVAREFLDRLGHRSRLVVGIGCVAADPGDLRRSRADADRALRVLRAGRTNGRVARASDIQVAALLLELGDLISAEQRDMSGPVARLVEYDARHRSDMVATLRSWLDSFGDVAQAAAAVHVHPNTFRYRLRRVAEIAEIDLNDPDARFSAMVELRLSQ